MQTYSHAIFNATIGKQLERRGVRPMYAALVIGSLVPDLPLTVLTIAFVQQNGGFGQTPNEMFGAAYDNMYFNDPVWITGHSLFHSPPMILLWLLLGWFVGWKLRQGWGKWFFWFAVGNALHSALDIVTHHNDGPLLFYPFDWTARFSSPISYWDPNYYGAYVSSVEHGLNLLFLGYFIWLWWKSRKERIAAESAGQLDG